MEYGGTVKHVHMHTYNYIFRYFKDEMLKCEQHWDPDEEQ